MTGRLLVGDMFAGIDIGANSISMIISKVTKGRSVKQVETLTMPALIGADTFEHGKISPETTQKVCDIIKGFKFVIDGYKIPDRRVWAVATSAIGEAENRDFVIDKIRHKTGLFVEMIDDADERFLIYKCLDEMLPEYSELKEAGTMVAYIGAGNVQISVYEKSRLVFGENIKIGTVRVSKVLSEFEARNLKYTQVLSEYIDSRLNNLTRYKQWDKLENIIIVSPESGLPEKIPTDKTARVSKLRFNHVYKKILSDAKSGNTDESLPAILIAKRLTELSGAKFVRLPSVRLCHGAVYDIVDEIANRGKTIAYAEDMLCSARFMAKKYNCDEKHTEYIEDIALKIFDVVSKTSYLTKRDKLLMQTAAVLHECGKFVTQNDYFRFTYKIIESKNLIGILDTEVDVIALAAKHMSTDDTPYDDKELMELPISYRVRAAKLIGILRLANAIDITHKQKISKVKAEIIDNRLVVSGESLKDSSLEVWEFATRSDFFEESLGMKAELVVHKKEDVIND